MDPGKSLAVFWRVCSSATQTTLRPLLMSTHRDCHPSLRREPYDATQTFYTVGCFVIMNMCQFYSYIWCGMRDFTLLLCHNPKVCHSRTLLKITVLQNVTLVTCQGLRPTCHWQTWQTCKPTEAKGTSWMASSGHTSQPSKQCNYLSCLKEMPKIWRCYQVRKNQTLDHVLIIQTSGTGNSQWFSCQRRKWQLGVRQGRCPLSCTLLSSYP